MSKNNSKPLPIPKTGYCDQCEDESRSPLKKYHEVTQDAHYSGELSTHFGGGTSEKVNGVLCSELCLKHHRLRDNPTSNDPDIKMRESYDQMKIILKRLCGLHNEGRIKILPPK